MSNANTDFSKIFTDIVNWIKRFLQFKTKRSKYKPYKIEQTFVTRLGILKSVTRDTPRAVRTYIFTPFNIKTEKDYMNTVKNHYDIHLCLDHLSAIADETILPVDKQRLSKKYTHRITILKASRWIDSNGNYYTEPILSKNYDFLGTSHAHRDKFAIPIFDEVVHQISKNYPLSESNFDFEIQFSQKRHMGAAYKNENDDSDKLENKNAKHI